MGSRTSHLDANMWKFKLETYGIHYEIENFSSTCWHFFPEHHLTPIIPDVTNTLGQVQDKNLYPNLPKCRVSSLQVKPIKAEAKFETGMSLCNGSTIDSRFKLKTSLTGSRTSYLDAHMQHALLWDHAHP
jgi:hypothetical protein